jgi:DNA-binding MarR family transcriptional regulator
MAKRSPTAFLDAFAQLYRRMAALSCERYGPLGLGVTQAKLLRGIGAEAQVSQVDLARATGTDPAATGRTLRTLIQRGWVKRKRSPDDSRAFSLELTPEGRRLLTRVVRAREAIGVRIETSLDARDVVAFKRIVAKILEAS